MPSIYFTSRKQKNVLTSKIVFMFVLVLKRCEQCYMLEKVVYRGKIEFGLGMLFPRTFERSEVRIT